jgi:hypothetical protein
MRCGQVVVSGNLRSRSASIDKTKYKKYYEGVVELYHDYYFVAENDIDFVSCLLLCVPQGTQMYLRIILAQFYNFTSFNNNSSTRSTLPTGLGQNPTRGPTATHHLSLPGLRYQTLLTTCQTSSPVED